MHISQALINTGSSSMAPIFSQLSKLALNNKNNNKNIMNNINIDLLIKQSLSTLLISTIMTSCIVSHPQLSYAANSNSGLEASKLFEKAERAIEMNIEDYKAVDREWSNAKKIINDNNNILSKTSKTLSSVTKQMTLLDTSIQTLIDADMSTRKDIESEIEALKVSTGRK